LRKVAVILRNLGKELRDGLLAALQEKDSEAGKKVTGLMVLWEDIPQVADRSLQEALRGIDSAKLALALVKADEAITEKIKSNISERAAATIDEETSLMSAPKKDDIKQAREELVEVLREMNEKGELSFIEE
jgi:flagellar motor switch protein FliG